MKGTGVAPRLPRIQKKIDRLFDRFLTTPIDLPEPPLLETEWMPRLDFSELDKEFVVRVEVPGMHKENLDINLEGNVLTISGHREFRAERDGENCLWREREEGRFLRSLRCVPPL